MDMLRTKHISIYQSHNYVVGLINYFLETIERKYHSIFNKNNRVNHKETSESELDRRAHFVSYRIDNAEKIVSELRKRGIVVDSRGCFLRIGFALYHDTRDVDKLVKAIREIN